MLTRLFGAIPIAALLVVMGCDFQMLRDRTPPPAQEIYGKPPLYGDRQLTQIWNEIASVIDTEADRSSECKTMSIGAKPCGGPWNHLVYSSSSTDEARLRTLIEQFNHRQAYLNRRLGKVSTCDVTMPPRVGLEGSYCVVVLSPYE
jgi:hypothetical protein